MKPSTNLNSLIYDAITEIRKIIHELGVKKEMELSFPVDYIYFHSAERLDMCLNSIAELHKLDAFEHSHAISLLMRNILSDYFQLAFLTYQPNNEEDRIKLGYSFYGSDLNRNHQYIRMMHEAEFITDKEFDTYNQMHENEDKVLGRITAANKIIKNTFPNTTSIANYFIKNKKMKSTATSGLVNYAFSYWKLFSKNEHMGWSSYSYTRPITSEIVTKWLSEIIIFSFHSLKMTCLALKKSELKEQVESISLKYGIELKPKPSV